MTNHLKNNSFFFFKKPHFLLVPLLVLVVAYAPSAVAKNIQEERKEILEMTTENWITWRYFNSRIMFYFTHLQSHRCGIKSAQWGEAPEKLNRALPIGQCDEENPWSVPPDLKTFFYTDEIEEQNNDSFIGLGKKQISTIYVQLTYPDGSKSSTHKFTAPTSILNKLK